MKTLLFTFLLLPSFTFAQLSGKYYATTYFNDNVHSLTFDTNGTFTYMNNNPDFDHGFCGTVEGGPSGQGHYYIMHDILILHFEPDTATRSTIQVDTLPIVTSSSFCRINFTILDEKTEGSFGCGIALSSDSSDPHYAGSCDIYGKCDLFLPRTPMPQYLTFTYMGYKTVKCLISLAQNDYTIQVSLELNQRSHGIADNTTWKYRIKKQAAKSLTLRSLDDHGILRYSLGK